VTTTEVEGMVCLVSTRWPDRPSGDQQDLCREPVGTGAVQRLMRGSREPFPDVSMPVAEAAYERLLTLPLHAGMSDRDLDDVVTALDKVADAYGTA
jgi:hypothetical protein